MTTHAVDIELDLGKVGAFSVVTCKVAEGISRLTFAELEIASNEDLDFSSLVRADARLSLLVTGMEARRWTLKVGKVAFAGVKEGSLRYRVELHPRLWLLRYTTATRKFRNMSSQEIVSLVLSEHQVDHVWRTTRPLAERNYVVQYRETALDFVSRLLEFEGVYYTFDDDGLLLLGDRSPASPEVEGRSYFELIDSAGALARGELGIHEVSRGAEVAPGAATVNDFNWKKPHRSLLKSRAAEKDGDLEIYDYPVGYREPEEGELLARLRLEALRVPARSLTGRGNVTAFAPARIFTFGGYAAPGFGGEYLLVEVEHSARNPAFAGAGGGALSAEELYENTFRSIPRDVPFRPPVLVPRPTVQGCHTAMVRGPSGEEIHTEQFGRFKAQFHWDREAKSTDEDSRWVRMLQETATSMTLARVGWEMHIAYIDGDPDRPVGIARNINGQMVPTYGLPAKKTMMTIKTLTYPGGGGYNELLLDDIAGAQRFDMRAERDYLGVVRRNRTETIGGNEDHTVDANMNHTVERDQKRSVSGDEDASCDGQMMLSVTKDRELTVSGNETVKIAEAQNALVDGDDTEEVEGDMTTDSGEDGSIFRSTEEHFKRKIGGSWTVKAKGSIEHQAGTEHKETVGGMKITTVSEGAIQQTVSGMMTVDVTGSVTRSSKEDMSVSAKKSVVSVSASASLKSAQMLDIRGEVIEIEATSKLCLNAAGLIIEMTPEKTTVKGTVRMQTDKVMRFTGNPENLTK